MAADPGEQRRSRGSFTRTLQRLCTRLHSYSEPFAITILAADGVPTGTIKPSFGMGVLKYLSDDRVYVCRALMSLPVQSWLLRPAYPGAVLTEYG